MDYIVLDMEWNQPWPGSPSAKKVLPVPIRGEIIQIGAVRLTEDGQVADEFQIKIRPKVYRKLNRRVSKLTGIKDAVLAKNGLSPFPRPSANSGIGAARISFSSPGALMISGSCRKTCDCSVFLKAGQRNGTTPR